MQFGTSILPSSRGSLEFVHRPMFLSYIRTVEAVYGNVTIFVFITLYKIVQ
jgi:hypothetical protein